MKKNWQLVFASAGGLCLGACPAVVSGNVRCTETWGVLRWDDDANEER